MIIADTNVISELLGAARSASVVEWMRAHALRDVRLTSVMGIDLVDRWTEAVRP